ncbi:Uu.00g049840.m01.CDS01 [Anthostomella pinea]|uniref:Uu.00g049840.m01.CDS01 n=1 Tax=Anthostomella pinea TaxID=933095 RepID=A0AAI8VC17_9PEZI|nr:Uu.00g049840.m01.CDS01 [Anthostomella pinea]
MLLRRVQEQRDEELARRLQYDDREDDYRGGLGDVVGLGNTAGHFMNDDYRRGAPNIIVPPPPPPPPAPVATFERANSATDYVAGVNRARGLRTSSMERRLADRFSEQRQGGSPGHRPFAHPMAPPPITSRAMGPPPPPQPPIVPAPLMRRHTAEEDLYDSPRNPRLAERVVPRRATTRDYMEEVALHAPASRRQSTRGRREPPKDSVLAGLTGQGQGMNRVSEWRHHVPPGSVVT